MIPFGAPPFIILAYSAGMMAVSMALLNLIQYLGLSRLVIFPKIDAFRYTLASFLGFLAVQILALLNIAFQSHVFDSAIISLSIIENAFIISGVIWLIRYRGEPIRRPPEL